MTNEKRLELFNEGDEEFDWFVEHIDAIAPELHRLGWIDYAVFEYTPGDVVVTQGLGDVATVSITELGRAQLQVAAVMQ